MPDFWENRIFRADFLAYLDGSGYRETVERFGSLLAALVREHANYRPPSREPVAVCELWSVAEDLRHTEAHLRWIADSPNTGIGWPGPPTLRYIGMAYETMPRSP